MTLLEQIQLKASTLPPDKQVEVLDFILFLQEQVRAQRLKAALQTLAELGTFADIPDPVAWQREIRKDRPLPGREG